MYERKVTVYIVLNLKERLMNVGFEVELEIKGYDKSVLLCDWQNCVNNNINRETINHFNIGKFTEFQLTIFNLTLTQPCSSS